ncbi:radical SAM protein [Burkholderia sp. BDU5]|uniref:radical SAM protein n=1 Tax=Burkholderia sp. BDU5 TaxID=1385590 RepID=UPI0009E9786F|nr:radical SAM protein [Burkholderia sp. BDU5]
MKKLYIRYESFGAMLYAPGIGSSIFIDHATLEQIEKDISTVGSVLGCEDRTPVEEGIEIIRVSSTPKVGGLSAPIKAFFNVTKRCNLYCAHCYNSSGERDSKELPISLIESAFRSLRDAGVFRVTLAGGEPLFHRNFDQIALCAGECDLSISIVTNGIPLSHQRASLLADCPHIRSITVSLDGATEQTNDRLRGAGAFRLTLRGLRELCDLFPGSLSLRITLCRSNVPEMTKYIELAKAFGIREIKANRLNLYGRGKSLLSEELSSGEFVAARDLFISLARDAGIRLEIPSYKYQSTKDSQIGLCRAGEETIEIDSDGSVYPCSFTFGQFSQGNLYVDSFDKVLDRMRSFTINNPWCLACKGRGGTAEKVAGYVPDLVRNAAGATSLVELRPS